MKVKANSVKQEYEKQDELKRSALRAVAALLTIPDAGNYRFCQISLLFNLSVLIQFFFLLICYRQEPSSQRIRGANKGNAGASTVVRSHTKGLQRSQLGRNERDGPELKWVIFFSTFKLPFILFYFNTIIFIWLFDT